MYYLPITLPLTEFLLCRDIKNLNSIGSWDKFWLEDCRFESQLGVREFESHVRCAILQWAIHTTFLGFLLLSTIHNMLSEPFSPVCSTLFMSSISVLISTCWIYQLLKEGHWIFQLNSAFVYFFLQFYWFSCHLFWWFFRQHGC